MFDRGPTTRWGIRSLITLAVVAAIGVAVIGGVRSFAAVSEAFGSPLVPLTADGMIIACTALRLAALARGWRLPGSLAITYLFIAGTVWLNVATAHGWSDAVAHALAPIAYAVLVEMLAHMLRLHLRLSKPYKKRMRGLAWLCSPIVSTRVWLHLARTDGDDPVQARALVQQLLRMSSRLRMVCPSRWWRIDAARQARSAALQTIRDGLLTAGDLAAKLPATERMSPNALLALVDQTALGIQPPAMAQDAEVLPAAGTGGTSEGVTGTPEGVTAPVTGKGVTGKPSPLRPLTGDPSPVRAAAERTVTGDSGVTGYPVLDVTGWHLVTGSDVTGDVDVTASASNGHRHVTAVTAAGDASATAPSSDVEGADGERFGGGGDEVVAPAGDSDEELVEFLLNYARTHYDGEPLGLRTIRQLLGVGMPKATRLRDLAGWEPDAAESSAAGGVRGETTSVPDGFGWGSGGRTGGSEAPGRASEPSDPNESPISSESPSADSSSESACEAIEESR